MLVCNLVNAGTDASLDMNFYGLRVGEMAYRELDIINPSRAEAMSILEVTSSCPCLRILSKDETIPPAGTGKLYVEYCPARQGNASIELLASTDSSNQPLHSYQWNGRVSERKVANFDAALLRMITTPEAVAPLLAKHEILVIDVRDPAAYAKCHIAESINASLAFLKTTPFLKGKMAIITGRGDNDTNLLAQVQALNTKGYDVKVLAGGVRRWQMNALPLTGTEPDGSTMALLRVNEYIGTPAGEWAALIDTDTTHASFTIGSNSRMASFSNIAEVTAALQSLSGRDETTAKLIVVSARDDVRQLIGRTIQKGDSQPIFYLEGGADALARVQAQQAAKIQAGGHARNDLATPTVRTVASPSSSRSNCGTCPQSKNRQSFAIRDLNKR